jgi:hypothetical protein
MGDKKRNTHANSREVTVGFPAFIHKFVHTIKILEEHHRSALMLFDNLLLGQILFPS